MSLDLDATLAAAQNNQSRHPIISLTSVSSMAEIPFLGKFLDSETTDEKSPNVITHSTGALCGIFVFGTGFRIFYTDAGRSEFAFLDITSFTSPKDACLVELADGNIGIISHTSGGGYDRLYRAIISIGGSIILAPTLLISKTTATHLLYNPFIIRLTDGTFLLVYSDETVSGATYAVNKLTSSDFTTWSSEGTCSIGGLTDTKRILNPSLLQIRAGSSTGEIWLWFDYLESTSGANELTNIYFSISSDDGANWAAATKFTNYTTYDTVGRHPITAEKLPDQMHLFFTEVKGVLKMDGTQAGYCGASKTTTSFTPLALHFNASSRKLFAVGGAGAYPSMVIQAIVRIDVDTWTIDACWGPSSVPAIPDWWTDGSGYADASRSHNEGNRVVMGSSYYTGAQLHLTVLDGDSDSFINYDFTDWAEKGIVRNVNATLDHPYWLANSWVDEASDRLYCFLVYGVQGGDTTLYVGYLDLTEAPPGEGEYYTFHDVFKVVLTGWSEFATWRNYHSGMSVFADSDYIVINCGRSGAGGGSTSFEGFMRIYQLSTGLLLKSYDSSSSGFPTHGISQCVLRSGKLWCIYTVYQDYGPEWPGMCDIDLSTDIITHHKPTWDPVSSTAGYNFFSILMTPDETTLVFSQFTLGMAVYDIASDVWTLHSNSDVPGLDPNSPAYYTGQMPAYDETTEMVYFGLGGGVTFAGVIGFCINGLIDQTVYQIGTYTDAWAWGAEAPLVQGLQDYEAVVALAPDASIYAFWMEKVFPSGQLRLKWDKESAELELADYILKGVDISVHRSIDGSPAQLDFSVSSGHLFDPNNIHSLMALYLEKGRMLVLKFGENISGINYWQDQGSFFVTEAKLSYKRGTYPSMSVVAQDRKTFFEQGLVQVSDYYQDYPEAVLQDVLKTAFGLVDADFDFPTFVNREIIYQQWIETQAKDIIDQICNRFGYFLRMTVDDLVSARKISNANSVDHTYSDGTKIIDFTPDDSFSDFTNQVIAIGHSLIDIPVVYPEERVGTLNGTCGWWGFKKDFTVYYSLDGSKKCQSPRLVILESTQSIMFQFAGQVHEEISYIDPDGLYCVVTVTAPDLTPLLISTVAGWALAHAIPDGWSGFVVGGVTIPVGRILEGIAMTATMMILASVGNFQYEVWARPIGNVRRTVQYISDDVDLQTKINATITKKFEEPLAYTETMCKVCADHELMVFQSQRKRVTFSKIAHLQDEEGDTLQIPHPYIGNAVKIFVTELIRKMKIPQTSGADGYFEDEIQGWNVT